VDKAGDGNKGGLEAILFIRPFEAQVVFVVEEELLVLNLAGGVGQVYGYVEAFVLPEATAHEQGLGDVPVVDDAPVLHVFQVVEADFPEGLITLGLVVAEEIGQFVAGGTTVVKTSGIQDFVAGTNVKVLIEVG